LLRTPTISLYHLRRAAPLAVWSPASYGQANAGRKPGWPLLASEGEYRDSKQGMPSSEALSAPLTGAKGSGRGMLPRVDEEQYTVQEAARILRTTERTVRRRLERSDLEGVRDPTSGRWRVAAHSVTAAMGDRPPKASQEPPEAIQEAEGLRARVEDLQRQLGRLEGQRELEAVTQSTLRESLERERERADRLEAELRDARRSWWSRWLRPGQ